MRRIAKLVIMLAATTVCGCRSHHLIFTTYTKVGLDVSTADGQMVNGTFGYKRYEGAIIPVDEDSIEGNPEDAKSVFAGIAIRNGWVQGLELRQVFGTGEAAVDLSKRNTEFLGKILELSGGTGEQQSGGGGSDEAETDPGDEGENQ